MGPFSFQRKNQKFLYAIFEKSSTVHILAIIIEQKQTTFFTSHLVAQIQGEKDGMMMALRRVLQDESTDNLSNAS